MSIEMVDVSGKPRVERQATASGKVKLAEETIEAIKKNKIKKGDPLLVAEVAAVNAAKQTQQLIPLCHQIPLSSVRTEFKVRRGYVEASSTVKAVAETGVEMEALVAVTVALATVWDMVKYLEKDDDGQYPETVITDVRVVEKKKK